MPVIIRTGGPSRRTVFRKKEGSGLGLSLAREITEAHGGTLELIDSPAGETTFRPILPKATA